MAGSETARDRRDAVAARIGAEVRAARIALALSTRDLAVRIGTSQPFVSNIENGRIFPSLRTLGLLAEALGVPTARLLPVTERVERVPGATGMRPRRPKEPPGRRLLGGADRDLAVHRVELLPGEAEPRPHVHGGEDFVQVLQGGLDVLREGEPAARLRAGEGLWLDGAVPHRLAAPQRAGGVALLIVAGASAGSAHAASGSAP
ncbi:MAG: XRE family transcriptional regulator [Microbacteriaceae bacterium]